jgi:hypothetical protein
MHPQIESMFDVAEARYLKPEELTCLNQYVDSLPERLTLYRYLRDHEIEIMQQVADGVEAQFPQEKQTTLERCLKNAILILRYSAMSMLLNDETFMHGRLINWLEGTAKAYQTEAIDKVLYQTLNQRLNQALSSAQVQLLKPHLQLAEGVLVSQRPAHAIA